MEKWLYIDKIELCIILRKATIFIKTETYFKIKIEH